MRAATRCRGLLTGTSADAAESTTVPGPRPGLSTETPRRPAGTLTPEVRAVSAQAPSADTSMVVRRGVFRRVEAPASVAEGFTAVAEDLAVAAAGAGSRDSTRS